MAADGDASKRTLISARVRHLPGRDQRELVQEALGVLHNADDGLAALGPRVAHGDVELGRQPGGDGDLIGPGRVAPREELQHRAAVGPVGVLGPELIRLVGAGNAEGLVLNDLDPTEALLERGDLRLHMREGDRRCLATWARTG